MRNVRFAALVLGLAFAVASASADDDLAGLWKAKKWFGPDARGMLVLQRSGGKWRADIAGRTLPATDANGEISFTLANGGVFRGKLDGQSVIRGFWWRFGTPVNGGDRTTPVNASPGVEAGRHESLARRCPSG